MGTTKIKTDATFGYIKALGNRQGPHPLASEWVATSLAKWFGLTVAEFTIFSLPSDACFDLPRDRRAQPGPAFLSRHVPGRTWGGSEVELQDLENKEDVTRLVVFDTWLRNCDRYPPDLTSRKPNYANVYLAATNPPGRFRIIAIDHTHCFDCGRDFSVHLSDIDKVKDEATYGLFPAFVSLVDAGQLAWCKETLKSLTPGLVQKIVNGIPPQWAVAEAAKTALANQIIERAGFIIDRLDSGWLQPHSQ